MTPVHSLGQHQGSCSRTTQTHNQTQNDTTVPRQQYTDEAKTTDHADTTKPQRTHQTPPPPPHPKQPWQTDTARDRSAGSASAQRSSHFITSPRSGFQPQF
ncbi:hypothetical protein ACOMHN_059557 [Nucella lapillus]